MQEEQIVEAVRAHLKRSKIREIDLRAVLFDMDGVLYDSMALHAKAWTSIMEEYKLPFSYEDVYIHEGRTADSTIAIISERIGRVIGKEEADHLYDLKSKLFTSYPHPAKMAYAQELLDYLHTEGLFPVLVTGSGHKGLFNSLDEDFNKAFKREHMVTSLDVKHGKPNPEPYLLGLQKGGVEAHQAVVVENAPLGVEAARAAGIFTIAINTGPLSDQILLDAGAQLLFGSMEELYKAFPLILKVLREVSG